MSEASRLRFVDGVRLFLAAAGVLGTAALLFFLTFRERPYQAGRPARPIGDPLLDLAVGDAGRIWAVGHNGRILRSSDGGASWEFPPSGIETPLAAVSFRDDTTGLAAGYGGVILRTSDGGKSWSRVDSDVDVYLTSVRFLRDGRTFAAGEWGTILASEDGGQTWRTITTAEHDFIINDLDLSPEGSGWAVGELGQALHTVDGGRSWSPRKLIGEETTLFTVDVLSPTEVWVGGADSLLLHTQDGGANWEKSAAPCEPTQLLRVRFAGARGYAVGRRCVAVTEDGGRSWHFSRLGEAVRYSWLYGLHVGAEEAWAAGYGEALFRAGPDDASWERIVIGRDEVTGPWRSRTIPLDTNGRPVVNDAAVQKEKQDGGPSR